MGKQSRRNREKKCPVCFEGFKMQGEVPDNALGCKNDHWMCVSCVAKVAKPTLKCREQCSGLNFCCPLCRTTACIENRHLLVVTKGSWTEAFKCFDCPHSMETWNCQEVDSSSED
eukprot:3706133-Prymnesium_polylepis.1